MNGGQLTRILVITGAALACIVALELYLLRQYNMDIPSKHGNSDTVTEQLDVAAYTGPVIDSFDEILQRPLFVEGRTPPAEPEPVERPDEAPVTTAFHMLLEGVAITPETRIAVVREISSRELLRLAEGSSHGGWTLDEVTATTARFSHNGQVRELSLEPGEQPAAGQGKTRTPKSSPKRASRPRAQTPNVAGQPVTLDDFGKQQYRPRTNTVKQIPAP